MTETAPIRVLSTQGTSEAYRELVPQFEKATGHIITTTFLGTVEVNRRLAAGETYDLAISSSGSLDEHIKGGRIVPESRTELARCGVGVAVKAGAPKPDIGTAAALTKSLLAAKSIGYSSGPSGDYIARLLQTLGIAAAVKSKVKQTPTGVFVGTIIASGEAEIGFQQVSELLHMQGVDFIGPLPPEVQLFTTFVSGIPAGATNADGAKALAGFLASPAAAAAYKTRGMEPV